MIKIGDRVKFINDVGGGIVRSFSGKNVVNVENEDGFEIPTLISQLIIIGENNEVKAGNAKDEPVKQVGNGKAAVSDEAERLFVNGGDLPVFYFAWVPENEANPISGEMKLYLLNNCNSVLLYNYSHVQKGVFKTIKSGKLEANNRQYLESYSSKELNDLPDFYFQLLYFQAESEQLELPIYKRIRINPVRFYKESGFSKSDFFTTRVMLIPISNEDFDEELQALTSSEIQKILKEKHPDDDKPKLKPENPDLKEVDLHIHELLDDTRGLSNHEMLEIQMKKFREELETAIKNHTKRIVFIHGIGNGTLKQEIHKELSYKFKKYSFQDASFKEYGFGATMVILSR